MGLSLISEGEGWLVGSVDMLISVVSNSSICFSIALSLRRVVFGSVAALLSSECRGICLRREGGLWGLTKKISWVLLELEYVG